MGRRMTGDPGGSLPLWRERALRAEREARDLRETLGELLELAVAPPAPPARRDPGWYHDPDAPVHVVERAHDFAVSVVAEPGPPVDRVPHRIAGRRLVEGGRRV